MYFSLPSAVLLAAFFASGESQLVPAKRQAQNTFCNTVRSTLRAASQGPSATAYCSSYISIPAQTSTKTTGTTTVTRGRTVTTTITTRTTTGNGGTTTTTTTVTNGVTTVTGSTCEAARNTKRQATTPVPRPSALRAYPSGPTLSSACSCLSIPQTTRTVSVVATITVAPRRTVTTTRTVQGNGKVTETSTVTIPSSTASTNIPAASCTPIIQDPSFEACPDSSIDTYFTNYDSWYAAGAASFQKESTDGYNSPYGDIHVHFYGNQNRNAQIIQPYDVQGSLAQGQTYTLTFALRVVVNDGISTDPNYQPCYINADFAYQEFWRRSFTSADGPGDWETITAQFQYPFDSPAQFDINFACPYNPLEVLIDNVQIKPGGGN